MLSCQYLPDSPSVPMSVVAVVFPITTLHKRLLGGKQHDSLKVSPAMTKMVKLSQCWLDNINIVGRSWLSVQHSKSQLIWEHQQRNQIFWHLIQIFLSFYELRMVTSEMLHYRKVNHLWEFVLWARRSSKSAKMRSFLLVKYKLLFSWNIGCQVFKCPVPTSTAILKIHNSNTLEDFLQVSLSFSEPSEKKPNSIIVQNLF